MNMNISVSFRGRSGKAWDFQRVPKDAAWARSPGAVIFAAPDSYGWRIIRVMELTGRPHDLQPIWALAEAERYGATAVFLALEFDARERKCLVADIEEGFSPVCLNPRDMAEAPVAAELAA
ncbi:hypothetical protein HAD_06685 [Hyphomonas adhaerens MHS-3]|uniref:Uncharacterized protein n=3 Tax=Hyphomonadaceae TaxID=69657 RepID=A0A069E5G8_9PROT|nr:hypothetical protein HAD_06685 [Hyphomonas adhaerens MHS-3]MBB41155.1 hypothetical protein [Hyphomonas sp.]HAE25768.1 hypothetical protein [Hyphomonas adhaerens]|tara:strand:+ start:297 stop:659 length:363 start_codon:yes stop_codon:yes gene_type:complete